MSRGCTFHRRRRSHGENSRENWFCWLRRNKREREREREKTVGSEISEKVNE